LIDLAQIWYIVLTCETRSTTNVQGQGVKGQGHSVSASRNGGKDSQIINNSAGDCWISLKFTTDYDHVT